MPDANYNLLRDENIIYEVHYTNLFSQKKLFLNIDHTICFLISQKVTFSVVTKFIWKMRFIVYKI